MRWNDPKPWFAAASLLLVCLFAWQETERISPGPLATPHAREAELAGQDGCDACHGKGPNAMAISCSECHTAVGAQLADSSGFHGTLEGKLADDCAACHVEHQGDEIALISAFAFKRSGYADREDFDHGRLNFRLEGRHDELACADCHEHADAEPIGSGHARFIGLDQGCATCHEDPHDGRFARGCETCHGQERPFAEIASFVHGDAFPLVGAHADAACVDCHEPGSTYEIEALAGHGLAPRARGCIACHESPHRSSFVDRLARIEKVPSEQSCALCHDADAASFAIAQPLTARQHRATGFPLTAPHAEASCEQCHAEEAPDYGSRYPSRRADDCAACHADAHEGRLDSSIAQNCSLCHAGTSFAEGARVSFKHGEHTRFALRGLHREIDCESCHVPHSTPDRFGRLFGRAPKAAPGPAERCSTCHEDAHRGAFESVANDCRKCHDEKGFHPHTFQRFPHGEFTGFALEGAHDAVRCSACHGDGGASERSFGFVADQFDGSPDDCRTCHEDVHAGRFEGPGMPRRVNGRAGCLRCHTTASFRMQADTPFDHGLWTGYRLEGEHAGVSCAACHTGPPLDPLQSLGSARGTNCFDCHSDPHVGQFAKNGTTDCAACHTTSAPGFRIARFDHDRTRFPLDEKHAGLDCAACHVKWPLPSGKSVTRFKPLGTTCGDCHVPGYGEER